MTDKLLSEEILATAKSLRRIRSRLYELIRAGSWPDGSFPDLARVLTDGLLVAAALERLASDDPTPRTPTYLDERR